MSKQLNLLKNNNNNDNNETIMELPIKKKKGRKSKLTKKLEQEQLEKNKIPIKLFPNLNEKIYDVIKIGKDEYFLDKDFNVIYDDKINQVGFIYNSKYILFSDMEMDKDNKQYELNIQEIKNIIKSFV